MLQQEHSDFRWLGTAVHLLTESFQDFLDGSA